MREQERRKSGIDVEDATWDKLRALAGEYGLAAELGACSRSADVRLARPDPSLDGRGERWGGSQRRVGTPGLGPSPQGGGSLRQYQEKTT